MSRSISSFARAGRVVVELRLEFQRRRILVVGDFILDRYTLGTVSRISPEAPVCVLKAQSEESRPGGAGNTILNLLALGQEVVAVGRLGEDLEGQQLRAGLQSAGADVRGILVQEDYPTPLKNRLIASNQQMIRVDRERVKPLSTALWDQLAERLPALLDGISVVAISDYGKGLLTPAVLRLVIDAACARCIPVVVDPKGMDYSRYRGATLIKPNEQEAFQASGLADPTLEQVAGCLLETTGARHLMITRAESGLSLFGPKLARQDFPTKAREVRDVTGAGDTVLATCAAALANELSLEETSRLANIAAGIAVERFGCARVSLLDLQKAVSREGTKTAFMQNSSPVQIG